MKNLFVVLGLALCAALPASAQNVRVDGIALTRGGMPAPGANVAICTQPATTTSTPCAPLATLCASLTDTLCGQPNPVPADGLGNYHFYIATGTVYTLQLYGSGSTTRVQPDQLAGGGGGSGGGFICGTTNVPGLPYWNGLTCAIDTGATFDPVNLVWNFEAIVSAGTITAPRFSTSGAGGILELNAQSPPGTVGAGKFDLFINNGTGLVGCRNTALSDCLGAVQFIVSGSTVLPATLVTANGGCNVYSSTATGATSSNGAYTSLHGVDSSAVSGYGPGQLLVYPPFVGTNLISFKVCNPTTSNITPASLTVFWDIK
jgi:hypothetical protein